MGLMVIGGSMKYTRREFGKLALAAVPAVAAIGNASAAPLFAQGKPNSRINGVQIGAITYSFRGFPPTAEAMLKCLVDAGLSGTELMGVHAEQYAGAPSFSGSHNVTGDMYKPTPEYVAYLAELKKWRLGVSMDKFKALRKLYNDAGVNIYAVKILDQGPADLSYVKSDDELDYVFNVAAALGCTHTTMELTEDTVALKRYGTFGEKHKIYVAYHGHNEISVELYKKAFALSKANMSNVDVGHYVAYSNGDPVALFNQIHDRIISFHMKDRKSKDHGAANMPWGQGDTPVKQLLQIVKNNKWNIIGTIEFEYPIPQGSTSVEEVKKCLQFCRDALA
jgi:sugar phosphate isomerase/epimerase